MPTLSHCSLPNSCARNNLAFSHFCVLALWEFAYSWPQKVPLAIACLKRDWRGMQFPSLPASHETWLHVTCSVRACVAIDVRVSFVEVASLTPSASSVQQTSGKIFRKRSGHKCMQPVGTTFFLMIRGAFTGARGKKSFSCNGEMNGLCL